MGSVPLKIMDLDLDLVDMMKSAWPSGNDRKNLTSVLPFKLQ